MRTATPGRDLIERLRAVATPPEVLLRLLADRIATNVGRPHHLPPHWGVPLGAGGGATSVISEIPDDQLTPGLLGQVLEALRGEAERTSLGAWFTPPALAEELVGRALPSRAPPRSVLDPACGGGAFLLAAHAAHPAAHVVGVDVDHLAVEVTRASLELAGCADHDVRVGDGLSRHPARYDLVVGNPPFLSQLRVATSRDAARRRTLGQRFGTAAAGYVDEAGLFVLAAATELLAAGGVAVLVMPEALLATAAAAGLREQVARHCTVEVVWRDEDRVFPQTPTCAVRLVRRGRVAPVRVEVGREGAAPGPEPDRPAGAGEAAALDPAATGWSHLLAEGIPPVRLAPGLPTLADVATATADFRDAYYLLVDHVREGTEHEAGHRLVTVGLIDPAHLRWGQTDVRFGKRTWRRPVAVDLPADFVDRRVGPKVLVATQSRVIEALVDASGDLVPSTPVITIRTAWPWHVGAALTSPVLTAVAARRHAGAARSREALKLSARQFLALPLPAPGPQQSSPAWDAAAAAYRAAHDAADAAERRRLLERCGRAMTAAYGIQDDQLVAWWLDRLPVRSG